MLLAYKLIFQKILISYKVPTRLVSDTLFNISGRHYFFSLSLRFFWAGTKDLKRILKQIAEVTAKYKYYIFYENSRHLATGQAVWNKNASWENGIRLVWGKHEFFMIKESQMGILQSSGWTQQWILNKINTS